jgi:hypothetical protein
MKMFYSIFLLILISTFSFTAQAATTGWKNDTAYYIPASNPQSSLSEQAAVTIAKQHINGRVLAISHAGNTYRIKILSEEGTVHIIAVDSNDGTISPAH